MATSVSIEVHVKCDMCNSKMDMATNHGGNGVETLKSAQSTISAIVEQLENKYSRHGIIWHQHEDQTLCDACYTQVLQTEAAEKDGAPA